jgi:hypothetical protein
MWQFLTNNINYTLQDDSVWDIMPCSLAEANRRLTKRGAVSIVKAMTSGTLHSTISQKAVLYLFAAAKT